jgi:polyhydroxyalkanoate synthesis regulator phasin
VREFVDRIVHDSPLAHAREEAEEKMQNIIKKGETVRDESTRFFKDVVANYTKGIEDIQKRFDDRVREVGDRLATLPAAIGDLKVIADRIEHIEERLADIEKRLGQVEGKK